MIEDRRMPVDAEPRAGERAQSHQDAGVIRVLLVGGHGCFRQALGFLLNRERGIEAVAQAATVSDARALLGEEFDVAVVDDFMNYDGAANLIETIRRNRPGCAVILLTGPEGSVGANHAGTGEVLNKSVPVARILDAVRCVAQGVKGPDTHPGTTRIPEHRRR